MADGGAGQNARIVVDGSTLNVSSWFSVGRGNGVGAVSSDLVLSNAAVVTVANFSAGFEGGNAANRPKGSISLNNNSSFTITGNGALNLAESAGSEMTMTLSNTAQVIATGTGIKRIGNFGTGTLNIHDSALVNLGNQVLYVGYRNGTGVVNQTSGTLNTVGQVRVGGSDTSGTGNFGFGTYNLNGGVVNLGGGNPCLSVGRGNNNQNQTSGRFNLNGGVLWCTNDVEIGYAGTNNYGWITLNGGTMNVGPSATKWLQVGVWDFTSGRLEINSGTLNLMNNTSIKMNRQSGIAGPLGGNDVIQNGGTVNFYSDGGATLGGGGNLDLVYAGAAASVNTYNLNGGTLNVPQIRCQTANGSRTFNFNGGSLRAVPSTAGGLFMDLGAGTVAINVRNGGAILDSNGRDIAIAQTLQHSVIDGDAVLDGGLTKLGDGTLTLVGGATYTGPTTIAGGTLTINPSIFVSAIPGALSVSNATLNLDVPLGVPLNVANLIFQNNANVNLNYGALSANPTVAAIIASGSLSAPGTSITINLTGIGFQANASFPLIDYTGTPLANLANFTLVSPSGVSASLSNNTANSSIDLVVTTAPQNLTWFGNVSANWDINTTANFNNGSLTYLEYGSGASTVGDAVRFDDNLFNDFVNPPNTNVNLTTALSSFPVTVDSTLPYAFSGPGSFTGVASIIKSNTGSLALLTSNSHAGGTFIYGGEIVITNENVLGATASKLTLGGGSLQVAANATNTTRAISVVGDSSLGVATNTIYQVSGLITGSGGLAKTDAGTLIMAGSNGLSGSLSVNQGTMRSIGNQTLPGVARVGNATGQDAVLNITGGTFRADNNAGQFASGLIAGAALGSAGDILLSSGTFVVRQQFGLGAGAGGYGAFNMSGGTFNCGSYIVVGFNNDRAVYHQTAGTVTISSNLMTIAAGGTGSMGVANISGGTFTSAFGTSSGIMVGERGIGVLNVSGAAVINVPTNAGLTVGPVASQTGWDGQLNLNGGTLTANRVVKGLGTGVGKLSLNGGIIKASTGSASFLSGMDSAKVYSGGVVFDDGGFAITVPQALEAPTDYGVNAITLANGGSGYLDAPIVSIIGGTGSNATAVATVSGGVVTGVTVTCRGSGYTSSDFLVVTFESGGANVIPAVANTPTLTANTSGGLVKRGNGTLSLTGANTYTGSNHVAAGSLILTPAHQVAGQPVGVASNATFGVLVNTAGAAQVGNLTFGSTTTDVTTLAINLTTGSNPTSRVLQCGTLTLNGTNTVRVSGTVSAGTFPIVQYTGAIAGSGSFNSSVQLAQGLVGTLSNHVAGSTLYVTVSGTPGVVWAGTNSVAASTNVWNLNTITNWLAAGVPTVYLESTPPGDPVTFNDVGSGVVLLSNTASPGSVTISNNLKNYSFSGTGRISGPTALTKQGLGTVTMSLAGNDYNGSTTVAEGVLQLGSATAIPDGATAAGVSVTANGTLDLSGFSETINGLSGSGLINNSSATAATLTVGNGNGGGTWSGTITNTGAGAVTLLKVGTGSLTLSGTNSLGGTSQFNGGTNYLTASGRMDAVGTGEFWVQQNAGTSSFIMNGGSLSVNNWFVVGRNNAAANGTFILNSGTVTKTGGGNVVVGSLNATGLLEINGGQFLNNGMLWLGENASANATLRLNGGLIQAAQVRPNNAVAASVAYFNGGVLQASAASADFLSTSTTSWIQSGGLVLDTQAFVVATAAPLAEDGASPGGGLTKLGSGTLTLSGGNSYSGTTVVSNGTLLVDGSITGPATVKSGATLGGIGTLSGVVTVEAGGRLAAGSSGIGALTLITSPVLNGAVVAEVDRNDGVTFLADVINNISGGTLNYGGTLVITNVGLDLQVGDTFTLFSSASYSGSFTLVSQTPNQIITWNTANLAVNGTISVASVAPAVNTTPAPITFGVSGNTLNLSWPPDRLGWTLQTNAVSVAQPAQWFTLPGSATVTNVAITIDPSKTNVFFRLIYP